MMENKTTPGSWPENEQQTKKLIKNYCLKINIFYFPVHMKGVRGRKMEMTGISDLMVCYRGKLICVEAKHGTNKPAPNQIKFLEKAKKAGAFIMVPYSLDDFISQFNKIKNIIDNE